MAPKFTPKQLKFIAAYNGNAADAARKAGYKGNSATLAQVAYAMLMKTDIKEAVRARQAEENKFLIADRQERQKFWTEIMRDKKKKMPDRIKTSELLGKSECDFTDNLNVGNKAGEVFKVNLTMPANGSEATKEPIDSD